MPIRRLLSLLPVIVLTASLAPAQEQKQPPQPVDSAEAQARTVTEMRNVGTAMFSWLVDQVNDDSSDLSTNPKSDKACVSSKGSGSGSACDIVQFDKLPIISPQDLDKLLVPHYLTGIPETDAWGHPYEYRLDPKNTLGTCVMAIRSAGKDGKFSGNRYELGNFPPADANQDLVWMDGFFIRWPERKDGKDQH